MQRRALGRDDLIASFFTISGGDIGQPARFSFADRVKQAASAGFSGVGLFTEDYAACRSAGLSDADMRAILDDHGVQAAELEFLGDWWCEGEREMNSRLAEEQIHAMADAFGSRHMNVGDIHPAGAHPPIELVAERFAALCDRAADRGLLVAIEFLPWTDIPDAKTAWEIARRAARSNGGILVDSWHYFRGAADPAQLRAIPAQRINAIQLDDAGPPSGNGMLPDTLDRRLPGEGVFDLVGFVRMLDDMGVQAPLSVEIISPQQRARPLAQAARMAHDTTRATLAKARAGR